jgi:hypothetical protein
MTTVVTSLDEHWHELVTAALLGTERRSPPAPPVATVADVVDDLVPPDDAVRMLTTVAAVAAARRAAFLALPPVDPMQGPETDARPMTPAAASSTWRTIVADWPVLEDEWMLTVLGTGRRLAPDVLVAALLRHRNDAVRGARVALAGGSRSAWLIDQLPVLAPVGKRTVSADEVTGLPELPLPPDLAELLTADAHTFVARLVPGFESGEFGAPHRAVLVNLFARCRPAVLPDIADALTAAGTLLSLPLAELCRLRQAMLTELGASAV